jgi:8-amino-7-oxononanoate synthase
MDKFGFAKRRLEELKQANLLRKTVCIDCAQGPTAVIGGQSKIVFCSNNYLNLANHPRIIGSVAAAMDKYGHGACASRLLSGTMRPHVELEKKFASLFEKEAALVFPSGWTANEAIISTIAEKGDLVLLDKLDHASIIDAAQNSPAQLRTYRRGKHERLERFLDDDGFDKKFIITESIFSMDGDRADLAKLVELKNKYSAFLIVDEAHALGCMGKTGAGLAQELGLLDEVDVVVGTMSKALGATGGVVASKKVLIELLINKARPFIYTTAPTVANCAAASEAIDILGSEPQRREKLTDNAKYLRASLQELGLNTGSSTSHIIPVIIGKEEDALEVSKRLYDMGFFVPAIRPPTVAAGTARLRLSLQCDHTKEQMDSLCEALAAMINDGLLAT